MVVILYFEENFFFNMRDWLCFYVEIFFFCCVKYKWKYKVLENRDFIFDWSENVIEIGFSLRKCFGGC